MSEMTPEEKKERLDYIRFKIKTIGLAALFIHFLRKSRQRSDWKELSKFRTKVIYDDDEKP